MLIGCDLVCIGWASFTARGESRALTSPLGQMCFLIPSLFSS